MTSFIIRRMIQTFFVMVILSFVTYGLMGLMPGDPLDVACAANPKCTPENLTEMKRLLGLDRPIYERYYHWVESVVKGDLGYSRTYRQPVMDVLWPRMINTLILGGLSLLVSFLIALPLGVLTSLKQNTKFDYSVNFLAFAGISAPSFWLGLMLMIVFSVWLGWLPAGGDQTIGIEASGFFATLIDRIKYLILPVATLSSLTIAGWVRYIRASMLETMRQDYIRTASAKGLSWSRVVKAHGLRNAMLPVVTIIALEVPRVVSGATITELVFAYQGVGNLMYSSILGNDFNVAMVSFVITCFVVLIMNVIADILYAYLDPRITLR